MVWSPLQRADSLPARSGATGPPAGSSPWRRTSAAWADDPAEQFHDIVDALEAIAKEAEQRVAGRAELAAAAARGVVIIGARNEAQLRDNLAAVDFELTAEQVRDWTR